MQSFKEYRNKNCSNLERMDARKMWLKYIEGEEEIMKINCKRDWMNTPVSLGCCTALSTGYSSSFSVPVVSGDTIQWKIDCKQTPQKQEVENTMITANTERSYLDRRLNEVFYTHERELQKQFHLGENTAPKTYKDVIDWIKNDKFTLNAKETKRIDLYVDEEGTYYGSFLDGIVWNGAGFTVDHDGFVAGAKVLKKALQDARDVVNTSDATAGLKALQDFQSWTYTAPVAAPVVA